MSQFILVELFEDGTFAVGAQVLTPPPDQSAYSASVAALAEIALTRGEPVLAKGVDHSNGATYWYYVDGDGATRAAEPGGLGRRLNTNSDSSMELESELEQTVRRDDVHAETAPIDELSLYGPPKNLRQAPPPPRTPPTEVTQAAPTEVAPTPPPQSWAPQPDPRLVAPLAPIQSVPVDNGSQGTVPPGHGTTRSDSAGHRQFVRPSKARPKSGLRGALYSLSGGSINLGLSSKEQTEQQLRQRIARPLTGSHTTAVLSLKGGIGKTSTTVGVGMILAEYRGEPPCAIDANPDSGDLAERAVGERMYRPEDGATISDILKDIDSINSLTELSRYMYHANRFHLIAGEQDPALSDALTAQEYVRVQQLVSQYYSVILTDCGTGVSHPAMSGILPTASNLIIAASYAVSGAKRARSTLTWLAEHGYGSLARNSVVVITDKENVSKRVDKRAIEAELAGMCKQLVAVPHDGNVADGDQISLEALRPETRLAYTEIAAAVVDGYV